MTTHLIHNLAMIAQEAGSQPGTGLKACQTFTIFIVTPIALFAVITGAVLAFTRNKK